MAGELVSIGDRRVGRRVVVAFSLKPPALAQLVESVGTGVEVVDIKVADGTEDIVLVHSTSRQLIGKVRAAFPSATVLIVEVEDHDHGVRLGGHVMRSLDAGADGYFLARSIDELATVIDRAVLQQETPGANQPTALEAPGEEPLSDILDVLLRQRSHADRDEG